MVNFGIVGYWGFSRGNAMVNLFFAKTLIPEHTVFVFNPVVNEEGKSPYSEKEFTEVDVKVHDNLTGWDITETDFRKWLKDNNIEAVLFNEYEQWTPSKFDLIKVAREENAKVYGFLVNERFEKQQADRYDRVFCPNMTQVRLMRQNRVRNFTHIPFSLDLNKFEVKTKENEKFTFFHPAGMIGVNERKNTLKVIEAFKLLNNPDTKLVIATQVPLEFSDLPANIEIKTGLNHEELIEEFKKANMTVYPPKWETIGIGILESLACGTPVITTDFPPMNEYVRPNQTGLLVPIMKNRYAGINIYACEIDEVDLKNKMDTSMNPIILTMLNRNARTVVEKLYNVEKNKHYLLDFLKKEFGDEQ